MKLLFVTTVLVFLLGSNEARKKLRIPDDILSRSATGWETIVKATDVLKLSRVFPSDRNLMKRIALVESSLNRTSSQGGLWNVGTCAFWRVTQNRERYGKRLKKIQKMVGRKFGISWTRMTYDQLQRPMYSLIAARMYLYIILTDGIPRGATAQSKVWSNYYHNCGESELTARKRLTKIFKKGKQFYYTMTSNKICACACCNDCICPNIAAAYAEYLFYGGMFLRNLREQQALLGGHTSGYHYLTVVTHSLIIMILFAFIMT